MKEPIVTVFTRYKNNFNTDWLENPLWVGLKSSITNIPISQYYTMRSNTIDKTLFYIKEIQLINLK